MIFFSLISPAAVLVESTGFNVLGVNNIDMNHASASVELVGGVFGTNVTQVPLCLSTKEQSDLIDTLTYAKNQMGTIKIVYQEDLGAVNCIVSAVILK
jgi:hypothetical protein